MADNNITLSPEYTIFRHELVDQDDTAHTFTVRIEGGEAVYRVEAAGAVTTFDTLNQFLAEAVDVLGGTITRNGTVSEDLLEHFGNNDRGEAFLKQKDNTIVRIDGTRTQRFEADFDTTAAAAAFEVFGDDLVGTDPEPTRVFSLTGGTNGGANTIRIYTNDEIIALNPELADGLGTTDSLLFTWSGQGVQGTQSTTDCDEFLDAMGSLFGGEQVDGVWQFPTEEAGQNYQDFVDQVTATVDEVAEGLVTEPVLPQAMVINGIDDSDRLGRSVSNAGDVNGDGIDDLIIGAPGADPNGSASGETYVVFGSDGGFAPSLDLSSLEKGDGSTGFVLNGIDQLDDSGFSVSSAGDINGDGFSDILIGAPYADPNGLASGETYVVFGTEEGFGNSLELSSLETGDGSTGFVIKGIDELDRSGYSVSSAGDINGDLIDDILIGAYGADPNGDYSGETYVVFGTEEGFGNSLELSSLETGDSSTGFVINGIGQLDFSGRSVSSAGDVNGDGFDDILIGAPGSEFFSDDGSGKTYVVFGTDEGFGNSLELSSLETGDGSTGFVINGIDADDLAGGSVSSAGDINGDGFGDILIGAPYADPNGMDRAGETYVVFGSDQDFGPSLDLSDLNGSNGFVIKGIDERDYSGRSVSSAGDINGDGFGDILIGAPYADPNGYDNGETYVVFGSDQDFGPSLDLSDLNGSNGFVIKGIDEEEYSGMSVSSAGDINGDGFGDILIGTPDIAPNSAVSIGSGQTYVVFGQEDPFPASVNLADIIAPPIP
jgi:hypothetical protein